MTYFTYVIRCSDGTFYTGKTTNPQKRLRQHNGEISGGAKYTRYRTPVSYHYLEEHISHRDACQRENEIKKLTHKEKEALISSPNK